MKNKLLVRQTGMRNVPNPVEVEVVKGPLQFKLTANTSKIYLTPNGFKTIADFINAHMERKFNANSDV